MAYTTINKGSSYFNPVLYTGNGATQSVTGVGFQPDFVWIKGRSFADHHTLNDAVRGVNKQLYSNLAFAEGTATDCLTAFNTDGFSVGLNVIVNQSTSTFVAWNWLGANSTTSNTSGTISSTVSANQTAGFSIVSYTGNGTGTQTVGHGLGAVPKMLIIKSRTTSANWRVYHVSVGNTAGLALNTTGASDTNSGFFQNTTPTSTVFTLGDGSTVNGSGANYIAYCFAEVKGYSKFGSYTGNGSTDGTFVYTGFKPAFVMWKRTDSAGYDWDMYDTARDTFNLAFKELLANANSAESASTVLALDILSNGFKLRTSNGNGNDSGGTYIYMAFAFNPFVTSGGIPVTAR
jgi:hypothetical protein